MEIKKASMILGTTDALISPTTHRYMLTAKIRSVLKKQTNERHFKNLIMEFKLTAIKLSTENREREDDVHCQIHQQLGILP